jgi:lysine-specific demethylase 8
MTTTLPPLIRRVDSDTRGRHLVAATQIEKGRLLFCERPMVALQSTGNVHKGILVCHYCQAFCGTPEMALQIAADPTCLPKITTNEPTNENDDNPNKEEQYNMIPCPDHCGHVYCCRDCQQDDWAWGGHEELCTGKIEDTEHPLLKFKQHAISTNEIFLLVAVWLARIQKQHIPYNHDDQDSRHDHHPYTDFCMNLWWDVACLDLKDEPMGFGEAVTLEQSLKRLCKESHEYLSQAWQKQNNTVCGGDPDWLTSLGISRLIGSLEQNCMAIKRKHAIRRNLMEDTDLRHVHHAKLIQCLEQAGMIGDGDDEDDEGDCREGDDDDDDDDDDEEDEPSSQIDDPTDEPKAVTTEEQTEEPSSLLAPQEEWDYTFDDIADFLAGLPPPTKVGADDEWDGLFAPMDGTAMFSIACKCNHSCEPNVVLLYKTRGWGRDHPLVAYCVALRDIQEGEELTISYIVTDDDLEARQKHLINYGFVCECSKCQREKEGLKEDSKEVEAEEVEEDLFGDDSEEEEEDDEGDADENDLTGEARLESVVERLESDLNHSLYATIPLNYLAPISTYTIQLATALLQDTDNQQNGADTVRQLLQQCTNGVRDRDFSLCRVVGSDLESILYHQLQTQGSWPNTLYREAYWCAGITGAIGFAQEGSFLVALKLLDKALILGQPRKMIEDFFSYVEMYAYQMAAAPCPPAMQCHVADYTESVIVEVVTKTGLSKPIEFAVEELNVPDEDIASILATLRKPAVIRKLARNWPAISAWRNMTNLVREHGHRLIPIEVGSMSSGMKEELVTFRSFVSSYLAPSATDKPCWSLEDATNDSSRIAYLAQHPLLDQIVALYDQVETKPCGIDPTNVNVWMGTGGTRTPLHFDSYDNLLVQLVGAKYVRLYDRDATPNLYVSQDKSYGLQGNMSNLDCEREDFAQHLLAKDCPYKEVLLLPGDCLYIPSRHWHYVRSLSTSISVNYWF